MLFSSILFLYIFLPLLLLLYFAIPSGRWRRAILIVFSLAFYAWGEPVYVLLLIGCVAVDYAFGLLITRCAARPTAKKVWLALSVVVNLSVLIFYKYAGMLVSAVDLLPSVNLPVPEIALPLGISFFTFQAMSYTIDVYRGDAPVQRSFWRLLLYVSLFPQLIAGPIVRYKDIDSQFEDRSVSMEAVLDGAFRFTVGLAKKVLIANACGEAADALLGLPIAQSSVLSAWFGAAFFAMQIYFDFSGYSDMAIGLGGIFGFTFKENFNYPYASQSATEFWRRWHISLSTFFRDYVYIPLGGNRRMWLRNVLLVWLLTGLWHGASVNFLVWGLYYGVLLVIEKKLLLPLLGRAPAAVRVVFSAVYMTAVTLVGWTVFYYTEGFGARLGLLFGAGGAGLGSVLDLAVIRDNAVLLVAAFLLSLPIARYVGQRLLPESDGGYALLRVAKTLYVFASLALCTVMLTGSSYNPFLYFRF